jgi:hypothetical protein
MTIPEGKIKWWRDVEEFEQDEELIRARHSHLGGAVGSMDGLSLPVCASSDPEIENAAYNAWKSDHRVNNVLVFSPQGMFYYTTHHKHELTAIRNHSWGCIECPWQLARFESCTFHLQQAP